MILYTPCLLIKSQYLFVKSVSTQQQTWSSNLDNEYDQGKKTTLNSLLPGVNSLPGIYIILFWKVLKRHSASEPGVFRRGWEGGAEVLQLVLRNR